MSPDQNSLEQQLDAAPISPLQWLVLAICFGINLLDGFDIQAIAYAAPEIRTAWGIEAAALGIILSAGFVGMAVGALTMGPVSDRIGRKPTILICMALIGLSTLACGLAQGSGQLMFFRVLTGFGIGGVLPSLNTLVAEYAPHRQRNLMVSLMHLGYPLGAIVGGLLASVLIPAQGWPAVFFVGGAAPLLLLPVVAKLLPESMVWLSRRSDDQSRRRLAGLLARLQLSEISADAPPSAIAGGSATSGGSSSNLTALFRDVPPGNTLLLWIAFFMGYLAIYFLMSWIPTILVDAGYALKEGINAGIVINLGGAIGMLLLARLTTHSQPGRRIGLFFAGATFAMFGIGQMAHSSTGILIMGFVCGLLGLGALIGLYTFAARLYPAPIRATGTGWAIGLGRFGAILGPAVGGLLIALEWALPSYFTLLALPFAVAAVAVSLIRIPTGTTGTPQP